VHDKQMQQKLTHSRTLRWHLPWGDFQTDLNGLNTALAALTECNFKKQVTRQG
jgi:hypothetical protein